MGEQSLRDHFAGLAMQELLSQEIELDNFLLNCEKVAELSYYMADAMLKEREKQEDELS